jgi:hypothetical protein
MLAQKHIFMKNNYSFKKTVRRVALFYSVKNLYSWTNGIQVDLHFCLCIQSDTICNFDWITWRKSTSQIYIFGKQKGTTIVFSHNWIYALMLHQNLISCSLKPNQWKICTDVELKFVPYFELSIELLTMLIWLCQVLVIW